MLAIKPITGVKLIRPVVHRDNRGWFMEGHSDARDSDFKVAQISYSHSYARVRRGMHFQIYPIMTKRVTVLSGEVRFVVLDLRKTADTFGQYQEFWMQDKDAQFLHIPGYCALGFEVFSEIASVQYYHDTVHNGNTAITLHSECCDIKWAGFQPIQSAKDTHRSALSLRQWKRDKRSSVFDNM